MTRINANIPTVQLTDQLLINEIVELPRVFEKVLNRCESGKFLNGVKIPIKFVLGTGHMSFFFDKCYYLMNRYNSLIMEYNKRHNKVYSSDHRLMVYTRYQKIFKLAPHLCGIWNAKNIEFQEANALIRNRIFEKSKSYKRKHTYYGIPITSYKPFLEFNNSERNQVKIFDSYQNIN